MLREVDIGVLNAKPVDLPVILVVGPLLLVENDLIDRMVLQRQPDRVPTGFRYMDKQKMFVYRNQCRITLKKR